MRVYLATSSKADKKYMVRVDGKTIHFGAKGMSDYTKHKDPERKARYIARHKGKEGWTKSSIKTAGFWSRWLLWGEPTLAKSISATEKKFKIKITRVTPAKFKTL